MTAVVVGPEGYPVWEKAPGADKDYSLDWSERLGVDTIASSTWAVSAGVTHDALEDEASATITVLWLSGGTLGARYFATNRIVSAAGLIDYQTIEILIKKK